MNQIPPQERRFPRFRRGRRRRARFKGPSFNRLIPNIMTLIGLCAGLTSIRFALDGRFGSAVVAIAVAACIDGLDGRLARLLRATSRFGAEFDSLADFLCFGVAPALVLYLWSLERWRGFGYIPCLMFAVCMALRLARFNASLDSSPSPAYTYNFFHRRAGAGRGGAWRSSRFSSGWRRRRWGGAGFRRRPPSRCSAVWCWWARRRCWSRPCRSGASRTSRCRRNSCCRPCSASAAFAALLVADPWGALVLGVVIYLGMLPFSVRSFRRLRAEAEGEGEED